MKQDDKINVHELNDCVIAMKGLKEWMLVFHPKLFPEKEETKFTDIAKALMERL